MRLVRYDQHKFGRVSGLFALGLHSRFQTICVCCAKGRRIFNLVMLLPLK